MYKKLKYWFDDELGIFLSDKIKVEVPDFKKNTFVKEIKLGVEGLELKARVELIADQLEKHLKGSFADKAAILESILGPENEEETGMFKRFYWIMPIAKFVEKYGLNQFDDSIRLIGAITKRNTGEYAIRPFLELHQDRTIEQLKSWTLNENNHLRRLCSEGVRPRLPWAKKLQIFIDDPTFILPILENLKDDPSKYVQKSVANCINDILKDNLLVGKELIDSWIKKATTQRKWIIKHAIRNLLKQDDLWALNVLKSIAK